ncbi:MAG TPA: hypothetical protein VKJ45_05600, partial [Blastocatellia bacterium]|nr:hypothetical protein [Blastocatellia bacterium]
MLNLTVRIIVPGLLLLLPAIGVKAQQPADQKKPVPVMSNDDVGPASSVVQPMPGSTTAPGMMSRYRPELCGLSIQLPAAPVDSEMPLSPGGGQNPGSVKYHASVGDGYVIVVAHYRESGQVSLEGHFDVFVKGLFQGFSSDPSASNVKYTLLDKSANRASFRGGYDLKAGHASFEGFAQLKGHHAWIVIAIYPAANAGAVQPVRNILRSATFDGEPCPD